MTTPTEQQIKALDKLREPFPEHQISQLPKPMKKREEMDKLPKGNCKICGGYHATSMVMHLSYVGHAALTDRLLDADPLWYWEPLSFDASGLPVIDRDGGMWIKLTVAGMTRLGYGDAQGKSGGDAMKERIGDALRNAAMRFGAALDLWHKGDLHIEVDTDTERQTKGKEKAAQGTESGSQGATVDPKDAEYHTRIQAALKSIYGADKQKALDKVEELTTFTPKGKTEPVKGVRNFLTLKGDRAKILAHNLEKLVQPATMCNECRQVGSHAESCPNNQPPE